MAKAAAVVEAAVAAVKEAAQEGRLAALRAQAAAKAGPAFLSPAPREAPVEASQPTGRAAASP